MIEFKMGDWVKLKDNLPTIFRDFKPNKSYKVESVEFNRMTHGEFRFLGIDTNSPYTKDRTYISPEHFELDIQAMRNYKLNTILNK